MSVYPEILRSERQPLIDRGKAGIILILGHDVPIVPDDGEPRWLAERSAGIAAWSDTTLDQREVLDLTVADGTGAAGGKRTCG